MAHGKLGHLSGKAMSRKGCNGGAQGFQRNGGNADCNAECTPKKVVLEDALSRQCPSAYATVQEPRGGAATMSWVASSALQFFIGHGHLKASSIPCAVALLQLLHGHVHATHGVVGKNAVFRILKRKYAHIVPHLPLNRRG